ncbi:MAG: 2-phosphosulfolactate phosphatase [Deltaproteobacteria bacterium]|nr:2-phosphosulfolactate phosphatase [Deltaproteobacteria bacterium]
MMRIDLSFSYTEHFSNNGDVYIAIDVLRTSSTITILLEKGIEEIRILPSLPLDEQRERLKQDYILVGEYEDKDIPGFDFSNSPYILNNHTFKKKKAALFTTNGTRAINACPQGGKTIIACFLNLSSVINYVSSMHPDHCVIILSGSKGKVCLEDTVCGGAVVERLADRVPSVDFDDGARMALDFWKLMDKDAKKIASSTHAQELIKMDLDKDIEFCSRRDYLEAVGIVYQGTVKPV